MIHPRGVPLIYVGIWHVPGQALLSSVSVEYLRPRTKYAIRALRHLRHAICRQYRQICETDCTLLFSCSYTTHSFTFYHNVRNPRVQSGCLNTRAYDVDKVLGYTLYSYV